MKAKKHVLLSCSRYYVKKNRPGYILPSPTPPSDVVSCSLARSGGFLFRVAILFKELPGLIRKHPRVFYLYIVVWVCIFEQFNI